MDKPDNVEDFQLIETILWTAEKGYYLLSNHMNRLFASAEHFGFAANREKVLRELENTDESLGMGVDHKVRLLMARDGSITMTAEQIAPSNGKSRPVITMADSSVDSTNKFLYHKTTNRQLYSKTLVKYKSKNFYDVIFTNEKGELTEGCWNNLLVEKQGVLFTPPVSCGLLNGVYRSWLVENKEAAERLLFPLDLETADKIYCCNSVRAMVEVRYQK